MLDFVDEVDVAQAFIAKQVASGGGDEPEDVAGGLEAATKLKWQSKARYAIFIADAPAHGKKYHRCTCEICKSPSGDCYGDSHPKGDPKGRDPELLIQKLAKLDVNFFGIKINNRTNTMF